jgi:hypothetical protein
MSPFSGVVLGTAAALSAPALWSSLVAGTLPVADGLLRYVVTVAICWLGLSVVVALVGPAPRSATTHTRSTTSDSANPGGAGAGGDAGTRAA